MDKLHHAVNRGDSAFSYVELMDYIAGDELHEICAETKQWVWPMYLKDQTDSLWVATDCGICRHERLKDSC